MAAPVAIGTTLYESNPRHSSYSEYQVLSIGRKWIQLSSGERCDFNLRRDRGPYGTAQLYVSIEDYERERRLSAAWSDLRRDLQYAKCPEGMTVDEINAIRAKCGLQLLQRKG